MSDIHTVQVREGDGIGTRPVGPVDGRTHSRIGRPPGWYKLLRLFIRGSRLILAPRFEVLPPKRGSALASRERSVMYLHSDLLMSLVRL